jgi:hypothetical protein
MSPKPISRRHILAGAAVVVPVGAISLLAPTEATVYAKGAALTQSSPAGVTTVYQGLDAVIGFYVVAWQNFHGIAWTQDQVRSLASTVVLSYEHAGRPGQTKPGRCAHLFTVHRGLISTLDWVTYYPGVP